MTYNTLMQKGYVRTIIDFLIDLIFYSHKVESTCSCTALKKGTEVLLNDVVKEVGVEYGPEPKFDTWIPADEFTYNYYEGLDFHDENYAEVDLRTKFDYTAKDKKKQSVAFLNSGEKRIYVDNLHTRNRRSLKLVLGVFAGATVIVGFLIKVFDLGTSVLNFFETFIRFFE